MPDRPFFMYFAPGATHAPHHVPKEWADKYAGAVRRRLGRAARAHVRPAEGDGRHPGRRRAHRAPRRDPGVGRHARRAQAGARARDGGLRGLPRAHRPPRRPGDRRHRRPRRARRHDHLLHHRRQRRVGRGHDERRVQRDGQLQRHGRARDARVHAEQDGRVRLARARTTTTRSAGRGRWTRPFQWTKQVASHWGGTRNGTIVHWPDGHRRAGRPAIAVHARDRHRADDPRGRRAAGADDGERRAAVAHGGHEHAVHVQRAGRRRSATTCSTSRCSRNRGIYHKGWSAVTKHRTPWVMVGGDLPAVRRRRLGALRRQRRLQPGARPRGRAARDARQAAAALAHRGDEVQRAADGRPDRRSGSNPDDGRAADPHPRQLAAVLPRHGPAVGEQRREHQEQVVLGHRRGRGPGRRGRRRDHRPGRSVRRLGRLRQGRQG